MSNKLRLLLERGALRNPRTRSLLEYYTGNRSLKPPGAASNPRIIGGGSLEFGFPQNVIQAGGVNQRLRERYSLTEPAPIPSISPELLPVVIVDDITIPQKNNEKKRCRDGQPVAMVNAGNRGACAVHNPADSGVLIELRHLELSPVAALYGTPTSVQMGVYQGPPTIIANFAAEYTSKYNAGFPQGRFYNGASTSAFPSIGYFYVGNGIVHNLVVDGVVLPPGYTWELQQFDNTGGAVMNLGVSVSWDESPEKR